MTFDDLRTLLDYNYWARDRMLEALDGLGSEQFLRDLGSSFKSIRDTAAHMLGAEIVWYRRWQGDAVTALPSSERFADVASLRREWAEHETKMRAFLDMLGEAGVNRLFEFKLLSAPLPDSRPFWQMLQHLVNHGTYHRGQVTAMLRQIGAAPPKSTDLIAFYRWRTTASAS